MPSRRAAGSELKGQLFTSDCAMVELDNDSQQGRDPYIRKICDKDICSFQGYNDKDGLVVQIGKFFCYKVNNGFRDEDLSDENFIYPMDIE